MEQLSALAGWAGDLCQVLTCAVLLIRPVREWLFGVEQIREGQRCLLRSQIVRIYYRNSQTRQLREYEYKNLTRCYQAYKALKGNSFIDHIYSQMQDWEII